MDEQQQGKALVMSAMPGREKSGHKVYKITRESGGLVGRLEWNHAYGQYIFACVGGVHCDIRELNQLAHMCTLLTFARHEET